jgi:hypothetical protein
MQRDEYPNFGYGLDADWFEGAEPEETVEE